MGNSADSFVQAAQSAMQAGRLEEAAQLWGRVLSLVPEHPSALLHLGQHALMRKDLGQAHQLLDRAARVSPTDPTVALNQAFVFRARGDAESEMGALTRALAIDPYFYPALLSKAMFLERAGDMKQAARIYKDVLTIAPSGDRIPPAMKSSLAHAERVVRENAAALEAGLNAALAAVQAKYSPDALNRFEACKEVALGRKKVYTQQPSVLHFPGLPAIEFYDKAEFPWLANLEAATEIIREEFLAVYREDNGVFSPYVKHPAGAPVNQWAELNHSPRWSALHLWRDGTRFDQTCARCPVTSAAAEAVPMVGIENFGPTVLFSALAPHTHIPPHSSSTNARLVVHLPLIVPEGCRFRVGGETRPWEEGKAWVFDDTIEHEAWNDSDYLRVILMIDIWNPYLTMAERDLVAALLNGIRGYYSSAP